MESNGGHSPVLPASVPWFPCQHPQFLLRRVYVAEQTEDKKESGKLGLGARGKEPKFGLEDRALGSSRGTAGVSPVGRWPRVPGSGHSQGILGT